MAPRSILTLPATFFLVLLTGAAAAEPIVVTGGSSAERGSHDAGGSLNAARESLVPRVAVVLR